eukprot:CAMPEP_0204902916 /NCGR_PEP_ID=MMETSP1397-20131031/3954_1 /ASSEMBLY_ACC=CAM_ASM_000891 /TAXON_ID=49980 /ORGANISM="Climacostomum Climacostomum virens, Strain Stock W-24" /LENGTH=260 /DNA_ID=CAMNT_0052071493 /DNA_START=1362 /DNA_END=2141 /DNA_ORIENTATION=+
MISCMTLNKAWQRALDREDVWWHIYHKLFPRVRMVGVDMANAKEAIKVMKMQCSLRLDEIHNEFTVAVFGSLGYVKVPQLLVAKYGEMFGLYSSFNSAFFYKSKLIRITLLGIPKITSLANFYYGVGAICYVCDTRAERWEEQLKSDWGYFLEHQFKDTVVLFTSSYSVEALAVTSQTIREMKNYGLALFSLDELSDRFLNEFFSAIIGLNERKLAKKLELLTEESSKPTNLQHKDVLAHVSHGDGKNAGAAFSGLLEAW